MTDDRDDKGKLLPDALRTPPLGKFLRRIGVDELPQLLNILKGDMSFVGPRPRSHSPDHEHAAAIPDRYKEILSVRPGLTGTAQVQRLVKGHELSLKEKLKLDWDYATDPESVYRDLTIMAATLPIFVKGNGAGKKAPSEESAAPSAPALSQPK